MAYSKAQAFKKIIGIIESGKSLRSILVQENMPSSRTFYKWLDKDEKKLKQYARACEERADKIFEEIIEIADTTKEGVVVETYGDGTTKEKKGDI